MNLLIQDASVFAEGGALLRNTDVRIAGEQIVEIGRNLPGHSAEQTISANGRVLMPGFVDAHTHALWAGDRLNEFEAKLAGASYLEILASGGGILATVRAVRAASETELARVLACRLRTMLREGTTSVEVKSGYGLTTHDELKMLRAILRAAEQVELTVVPTALLGHALDPEQPGFVERVVSETLPAIHAEFPGITVDCYCEHGSWSLAHCRLLLERARDLGHPVRIHADQFQRLGGLALALELGALSVDHLEASSAEDLAALARSPLYGVMLPACGFHLDGRYADARSFLDAGGKLVLASNFNPGSSPTSSLPFVIALAVRKQAITPSEAIVATTRTPALLLDLHDRGSIRTHARADLILLRHDDPRSLAYEVGGNPVDLVICAGKLVS